MSEALTDRDRWIVRQALLEFAETEEDAAGHYETDEARVLRENARRARELIDPLCVSPGASTEERET